MSRKYIQLSIVAILLSGMLFVMGMNDVVLASNSLDEVNAKIEDMLMDKLNIEGNADFIIRFNEQADLTPAYSMDWDTRGEFVYKTLLDVATRSQENAIKILESNGQKYQTYIAGNDLYVVGGNLAIAQEVASLKEVNFVRATRTYYIDPVVVVKPFENITWAGNFLSRKMLTTVGSSLDALAWGIADTGANQFWTEFEHRGESIVVANIDTGVQWNHPALDQAYKCGTDPTNSACWRDPSNICGISGACDNNGHGTHTMGTMVGDDDPSLAYQVGMAPNAKWIACKGCESNSCSDSALNACADWILAPGGNTNNRPNLVNNSWGGGGGENWYLAKVNAWRAAGIFPAFSAGNEGEQGCSSLGSPGDYQESFGSAAHDISGNIGNFSSRGPSAYGHEPYTKPNISAPGVSICSTLPGGSWSCGYSGTSMASPHTAGAVALLWSCNPSLIGQIDQTFQILQDNADAPPAGSCSAPPDGEGNYTYGYGYLNILAAGSLWCGGTGTIDGHVYDITTNNPIDGAIVHGVGSFGLGPTVITDPNGYYTMTVAPDVYSVTASMVGYIPITASLVVVTDTVTTQDFELLEQISVVPDPIHINLTFGQTGSLGALATNNLTQPYTFDFKEIDGGIAAAGQTINSSGGPDPFGYIFDDSSETGGAQFDWIDATDGTPLGLADDGESNVTLPFSFNFYGVNSTAIRVGNNGGLLFGVITGDLLTGNVSLTSATTNNLILPYWDDIDSDTGNVYYKTIGDAPYRQFIVEWFNRPHYSNIGSATFELILYETTNNIKYQYLDVDFGNAIYNFGVSATAGIRQTGSNYLQYSYNQAVIQNGMAICFTYPGSEPCDGGDVPWLGESIQTGIISANGGTMGWTNYFTATEAVGIDQPGEYFATLRMQPTTEVLPVKLMSVNMTVLPSQTQGLVVGNVNSDRPGRPLQADILIESSGGITWTLQTDLNGYYSYYLHAGSYSVTASTNGYIPKTNPVVIVGQQTTVQNFILSLDAPEIAVNPTNLEQSLIMGQVAYQTLNISNIGNELLTFEITERNSGFTPTLMGEDFLVIRHDSTAAAAMKAALTTLGYTYLEVSDAEFQVMTVNQLLNYLAVFHAGTTGTSGTPSASEILLMAYLDAGGSLFISDNDLGYWRQGSVFYNTYLQSTYNVDDGGGIVNGLNLMAGLTLDITADPYPDGFTVGAEGTPIFQFQGSVHQNGVAINRNNYRAIYTAFDFQNIADPAQEVEVINRVIHFLVANDIEWLFEEPISGTIAVDNSIDINVKFDAGFVAQPGEYTADLKIRNNDPYKSQYSVPVTMTVLPTADFGKLSGTVTSLGYCDSNPTPLTEVDVQIQGADGYTQTLITDDSGYYQRWLNEVHSPLTITVTYPEHGPGLATGIIVTGGNTTTQDFDLRWLMPCMSVDPISFEVTLAQGDATSLPLTIINDGALSSGFEIIESTGAQLGQSRPIETVGTPVEIKMGEKAVISNPYPPTEVRNQAKPISLSPNETTITHSVSQTIISGNSVACSASGIHADNHFLRVFDLPAFGIDNDFNVTSVDIGIEEALAGSGGTQPAELRLYTLEGPFIWANMTLIASAPVNVTDQSLTIINMPVGGTIPAGSLLVVDFFTPDGDAAGHSMFVGSNNLGQTAPTYIAAADCGIIEPTDTTLIGYPGMHLVMNVNGEVDSQDLPWLSEIPTNGTVNADSIFDVTVSFDSMTYTVGTYTGILVINTVDPVNDRIGIPVTMHVFAPQAPVVSYTSNSPVMIGDPVLFTNTSNPGVPAATEFGWDYGDGVTETLVLEDPVSHLYTANGTYLVTLKGCNMVDCDTFSADVTVFRPPINRFFLPLVNR